MGKEDTNVTVIPQLRQVFYAAYADLPTGGIKAGDLGYATDRKVFYRWSGSAWESLTIYSGFGTAAAIPAAANLPEGSLYYETNTTITKQVQSGAWVTIVTTISTIKVVRKTADETVNNSGVLQNDNHLLFAIAANEEWQFEIVLFVTAGNSAYDICVAVTYPSGATVKHGLPDASVTIAGAIQYGTLKTASAGWIGAEGSSLNIIHIVGWVLNDSTAGNVQLQWSQYTEGVADLTVGKGSYLIAHKLN